MEVEVIKDGGDCDDSGPWFTMGGCGVVMLHVLCDNFIYSYLL